MTATAGLIPDEYRHGPSTAEWRAAWDRETEARADQIIMRHELQCIHGCDNIHGLERDEEGLLYHLAEVDGAVIEHTVDGVEVRP